MHGSAGAWVSAQVHARGSCQARIIVGLGLGLRIITGNPGSLIVLGICGLNDYVRSGLISFFFF